MQRRPSTLSRSPIRPRSEWSHSIADGRVERFVEKPAPGTEPSNQINAGTYVLEPSVLDLIPSGRRVSIERDTFPQIVARRPALRHGH